MTQPAINTTPRKARRMSLAQVTNKRVIKPWSILTYGPAGIGKSTFAAAAPSPVFITAEDGLSEIVDENGNIPAHFPQPTSFNEVLDCVDELLETDHSYKTLAVDTVDWLEPLVWAHMFRERKTDSGKVASSIEDYGYGKGYVYALDEWRRLISRFEKLMNAKGMNVMLLAHSQIKPFSNPEGVNFDRYTIKVQQKAGDFLREWVKAVLFVNYEILGHKSSGEMKAKGVGSGARVMHTEQRPAFDAKNRYSLPSEMQFDFAELSRYISGEMKDERANELRGQLVSMVAGTPLEKPTAEWLAKNPNNVNELQSLINRASTKLEQLQEKAQ